MSQFRMYNERDIKIPFRVGSELQVESFRLTQYDNTYMLASPRYYNFYASYIRPRILQYAGWMDEFHNVEYGILPTMFLQKVGKGIVNTIFSKPIVLNSEDANTNEHITSAQFKKSGLKKMIKKSYELAVAGGTALLKWNKDANYNLRADVVPMDRFFVTVDAYGDIEAVKAFVATYHDTIGRSEDGGVEYYLCEERFFRYAWVGGQRLRKPFVHYTFYKTTGNIAYNATPNPDAYITWSDIPASIRKMLKHDFGDIYIDSPSERLFNTCKTVDADRHNEIYSNCVELPFNDDLGCRLVKFTENIPAFPVMPFGQPLADLLMNESYQYDQLKFFERVEVYLSRGRAMADEGQMNPNDPDARKSALDPVVFTFYDNSMSDSKDGRPYAIQMELRAGAIKEQKQNILNDTAFALNLSSSTVAGWLSDGTTQKTATEIEYERTKTESFINEKIAIIQEPLQEFVDLYFHYHGLTSPELKILPEEQTARSDSIRLYSELYEKNQVTAQMLAEKILGTSSQKEVNELANYIEENKTQQSPQNGGFFNTPNGTNTGEQLVPLPAVQQIENQNQGGAIDEQSN